MHGNKPSRGAMVDQDIAQEEAELLEKKKNKTDSLAGKKMEAGKRTQERVETGS